MCGFAGFLNFDSDAVCTESTLKRMGDALKYRGPDEESIYKDDQLSLVFRRLSIVDLDGGSQPIWNDSKNVFVVVNGEIYNHVELRERLDSSTVFNSQSDSEIILHLYLKFGHKTFEMLNGMFSIVIWDTRVKKLTLARDRLGIKPLYYTPLNGGLLFASELKALLIHPDCPRDLNWQDLSQVGLQDKQEVSTYVQNVHHFPSGHFLECSRESKNSPQAYWDIENFLRQNVERTDDDVINLYSDLLNDSTKKRLMADVPVGIFLSGGIDSSLITAIAASQNKNLHCFTVVEKATYESGDVENARKMAHLLGVNFYPILFDLDEILEKFNLNKLEQMIAMIESPRFDLEWYYKSELHKSAKALVPELKVVLLGQGADEFCGGYSNYLGSSSSSWDDYINNEVTPSLRNSRQLNEQIPKRFTAHLADKQLGKEPLSPYKQKMQNFVYQLQFFNLWHEDRSSSFYGIESRVPFLDHRLIELVASVPERQQESLFWDKQIVRKVAAKQLPSYPKSHPKVPFFVTDDHSFLNLFAKKACDQIFTEFKDKYRSLKNLPIDMKELDTVHHQSQQDNAFANDASWMLIEQMSTIIFQYFCYNTTEFLHPIEHSTDDSFPLFPEDRWHELNNIMNNQLPNSNTEWLDTSVLNIPFQCEILNPLTEGEGATCLVLQHKGREIQRINIPDSHDWIVMMLDEMGRHLQQPKSLRYWAEKTNKTLQEMVDVANNLVVSGFLTKKNVSVA